MGVTLGSPRGLRYRDAADAEILLVQKHQPAGTALSGALRLKTGSEIRTYDFLAARDSATAEAWITAISTDEDYIAAFREVYSEAQLDRHRAVLADPAGIVLDSSSDLFRVSAVSDGAPNAGSTAFGGPGEMINWINLHFVSAVRSAEREFGIGGLLRTAPVAATGSASGGNGMWNNTSWGLNLFPTATPIDGSTWESHFSATPTEIIEAIMLNWARALSSNGRVHVRARLAGENRSAGGGIARILGPTKEYWFPCRYVGLAGIDMFGASTGSLGATTNRVIRKLSVANGSFRPEGPVPIGLSMLGPVVSVVYPGSATDAVYLGYKDGFIAEFNEAFGLTAGAFIQAPYYSFYNGTTGPVPSNHEFNTGAHNMAVSLTTPGLYPTTVDGSVVQSCYTSWAVTSWTSLPAWIVEPPELGQLLPGLSPFQPLAWRSLPHQVATSAQVLQASYRPDDPGTVARTYLRPCDYTIRVFIPSYVSELSAPVGGLSWVTDEATRLGVLALNDTALGVEVPVLAIRAYLLELKELYPTQATEIDKALEKSDAQVDGVVRAAFLPVGLNAPAQVVRQTRMYHEMQEGDEDLYLQRFSESPAMTFKTAENNVNGLVNQDLWLTTLDDVVSPLSDIDPALQMYASSPGSFFVDCSPAGSYRVVSSANGSVMQDILPLEDAGLLLLCGVKPVDTGGTVESAAALDALLTVIGTDREFEGRPIRGNARGGDWTNLDPNAFLWDGYPVISNATGDALARAWLALKGSKPKSTEDLVRAMMAITPVAAGYND